MNLGHLFCLFRGGHTWSAQQHTDEAWCRVCGHTDERMAIDLEGYAYTLVDNPARTQAAVKRRGGRR